jgi:hypothetical protein
MTKRINLSQDDFDRLLKWFGPDRDVSAKRYLETHERLARLFHFKGCNCPEDLADEVMDRVAKKLPLVGIKSSDHIAVLLGYARNVLREYWREEVSFGEESGLSQDSLVVDETAHKEARSRCLDSCLGRLSEDDRWTLLEYYKYEPGKKIEHRKTMAERRQTTLNALRLKACRLKFVVADCVKRCFQVGT